MRRTVTGILKQYGTTMTLEQDGDQIQVKGFFQPVRSKSWQSMVRLSTPLGEISRTQYIYIGPADVPVKDGDGLTVGERQYLLRRAEAYDYCGESLYIWGLCIEKGVNDQWANQS